MPGGAGRRSDSLLIGPHARRGDGAHVRARTGDLFLTKEVLCQLSYVGARRLCRNRQRPSNHRSIFTNLCIGSLAVQVLVGREGIEPPQSKTADLQSAELTTCSTYPRNPVDRWCAADRAGVYRRAPRPLKPAASGATSRVYGSPLRVHQAEETRERILDATVRVMARGLTSVSIPAGAREAGVSVPTIYRHFGTKTDLLAAVYPR
jgi:hypothetical protein